MVTVHIIDDDGDLPSLSIEDAEVDEGDQAEFVVRLSKASDGQVEVDYQTKDGTATEGTDYTRADRTTLIFEAGQTQKTIEVQTTPDELDEANEEFSVELSNPNGATLSRGTGTGTITDDDEPTLSIEDATAVVEGGTAEFVVEMSIPSTQSVTVDYRTADGSARAGMDYTATPGSLTFSPNTTRQTIRVPTQDDATDELVETFTVTLRNPSGATLVDGTATGTINDNDVRKPLHRRCNGRRREHRAVRRDAEPGERPDRNGELRDGERNGREAGTDYTATSGTLTFSAGESN